MKLRNFLYRLLVAALVATMLLSGSILARYVIDALQQKKEYTNLAAQVDQHRQTAPELPEVSAQPTILPEYAALYGQNSDLVGWMTIAGTSIHYPVMQSPDRADFYLDHNFQGQETAHGCLYVRESCDVFASSDNVTIYGHHMRDGSMFGQLDKFRKEDFYQQHSSIRFDTLYERHTYTVFAVFTTSATATGFAYHLFEDAADEAEFQNFVSTCKSLSLYDTGITPTYGDKLICLSTCEYSQDDGRLVVAALRD